MTAKTPAPAAIGQTFTPLFSVESYTVSHIEGNAGRPNLCADLKRRGYDGSIYTADRVTEGTRKHARTGYFIRAEKSGEFQTMW